MGVLDDIAALQDAGLNTAQEVRVALRSVLSAVDPYRLPPELPHASDVEFLNLADAADPTAVTDLEWANQGAKLAKVGGGRLLVNVKAADTTYGGLVVPAPAGSFTVSTRLRGIATENYHALGLLAVNDSPLGTYANWRECIRAMADNNGIYHTNINSSWAYGGSNRGSRSHLPMWGDALYLRWSWNDATDVLTAQATTEPGADDPWINISSVTHAGNPPTYVGFLLSGESSATHDLPGSFDFLRFDWSP